MKDYTLKGLVFGYKARLRSVQTKPTVCSQHTVEITPTHKQFCNIYTKCHELYCIQY
jgi:hypothetical protein